jgi:hypothetical protein
LSHYLIFEEFREKLEKFHRSEMLPNKTLSIASLISCKLEEI